MAIDQSFLDELLYRCDLVELVSSYLPLKQSGNNHWGLCPFHNEKTPSFSVSRDRQIFKCFGCGEGGNALHFIMKVENLPFIDAVRQLCQRVGIEMPEDDYTQADTRHLRQRLASLNKEAARYYHDKLMGNEGSLARDYLMRRGISLKTARQFGLGWADDNWTSLIDAMLQKGYTTEELERSKLVGRGKSGGHYCFFRSRIMFPVIDTRGDVVAFGGRILTGDGPKYINSSDTLLYNKSRTLYGMNFAKKSRSSQFILCEGNIDVIALHQAGFDSAIASCGTAFTPEQAQLLGRLGNGKEVVICFDADPAGQAATQKAITILKSAGIDTGVLKLPNRRDVEGNAIKTDPDDYIREYGRESFAALLNRPQTDGQYRLGEIRSKYNLDEDAQRIAYLKDAAAYIATITSPVEREIFSRNAAREAGVGEESMTLEVRRAIKSRIRQQKRRQEQAALAPRKKLQPPQREIHYGNPVSAQSEEKLIAIFLTQEGVLAQIRQRITADDFSSEYLAKIYKYITERLDRHLDVSPASCMTGLNEAETRRLTDILTSHVPSPDPLREAGDYINKILTEKAKTLQSDDVLLEIARRKRDKDRG